MLSDAKKAEYDQAGAEAGEALPMLWAELHRGLKRHFNEQQAWELTKVVVFAQSGGKGAT